MVGEAKPRTGVWKQCGGESKKAMETARMCLDLLFDPYPPLFGTLLGT